jgi:hypothetical protein
VPFASLPDPASPDFPAVVSILMGFAGTSYGFWRQMPRAEVQWAAFFGAYLGVAAGLVLYMTALLSEL